jgi:hypothetical protein
MKIPHGFGHDSNGDYFSSSITGKRYHYEKTPDGSGKRAALQQLEADDGPKIDALRQRIGRDPTLREIYNGVKIPDARPLGEQVRQDSKPASNQQFSNPENPYVKRLQEIESRAALTQAEKGEKARLLERIKRGAEEWEAAQEKKTEEDKNRLPIESEIQLARDMFNTVVMPSLCLTQPEVEKHRAFLAEFEQTGNLADYKAARTKWKAEVAERQKLEKTASDEYFEKLKNMPPELRPEIGEDNND